MINGHRWEGWDPPLMYDGYWKAGPTIDAYGSYTQSQPQGGCHGLGVWGAAAYDVGYLKMPKISYCIVLFQILNFIYLFFYAKFVSLLYIGCPAVSMMYVGIIDCSTYYITIHSIDGLVHSLKYLEVIDPSNTANCSQSIGQTR